MGRQFPPGSRQQQQGVQGRQAFGGSRAGTVRNATPLRDRPAGSRAPGCCPDSPSCTGVSFWVLAWDYDEQKYIPVRREAYMTIPASDVDELTFSGMVPDSETVIADDHVLGESFDYTIDGDTLTFDPAIASGSRLWVEYWTTECPPPSS